jgi:hypothetical protein
VVATGLWPHSRSLVQTGAATALVTVVVVALASGDRAVSLCLVAYGLLLWQASRKSR